MFSYFRMARHKLYIQLAMFSITICQAPLAHLKNNRILFVVEQCYVITKDQVFLVLFFKYLNVIRICYQVHRN